MSLEHWWARNINQKFVRPCDQWSMGRICLLMNEHGRHLNQPISKELPKLREFLNRQSDWLHRWFWTSKTCPTAPQGFLLSNTQSRLLRRFGMSLSQSQLKRTADKKRIVTHFESFLLRADEACHRLRN